MHKSRLGALVIDCQTADLTAAAAFWSAALGYSLQGPEDDGRYAELKAPDREMKVLLQKVEHPSRVHLDIEADDVEAEAARLEKLGARRIEKIKTWIVMEAPSGHRFCIVRPQRPDLAEHGNSWS
ncbi:MAG TPA: VOC family protein [Alphaproteobacteria bacterium]